MITTESLTTPHFVSRFKNEVVTEFMTILFYCLRPHTERLFKSEEEELNNFLAIFGLAEAETKHCIKWTGTITLLQVLMLSLYNGNTFIMADVGKVFLVKNKKGEWIHKKLSLNCSNHALKILEFDEDSDIPQSQLNNLSSVISIINDSLRDIGWKAEFTGKSSSPIKKDKIQENALQ